MGGREEGWRSLFPSPTPHSTGFRVYSQLPRAREIGKNARDTGTHFHPEFKSNLQIIHVSMPQRLRQDMDGKAGTSGEKARTEPSCFLLCPKCCLSFAFLIPQSHTRGRCWQCLALCKGSSFSPRIHRDKVLLIPGTKKKKKIIVSHVTCQGLVTPTPQARADDLDWMLKLWLPRRVLAAAQLRGPLPLTSKPTCWWH